jgi:hypothetical protein
MNDSSSDMESLSEISGDEEPLDGDDVTSEVRSDSEDPNSDDDLFIASDSDDDIPPLIEDSSSSEESSSDDIESDNERVDAIETNESRKRKKPTKADIRAQNRAQKRAFDASRKRAYRASLNKAKLDEIRAADTQQHQVHRASLTPAELDEIRGADAHQHQAHRAVLTPGELYEIRAADAHQHQAHSPTFLEACKARGLTADDAEWKNCLRDACMYQTPFALRNLFAIIVINNAPTDVLELFNLDIDDSKTLKEYMSEDFLHHRKIAQSNQLLVMDETDIYECLLALDIYFRELSSGTKNLEFFNLPSVPSDYIPRGGPLDNSLMRQELDYDKNKLHDIYLSNLAKMNPDQTAALLAIRLQIDLGQDANSKVFFLDAPGGTGKTFVFNTVLAHYRSKGKICLALASSGIAAILLTGGRTGHSRFKIPLAVNSQTTLKVSKRSNLAKLLIAADIIIWDEAPMQSKNVISSVDRLLRQLMGEYVNGEFQFSSEPFGGKVIIFGGDFRQNTPVIPKANRAGVMMQLISKCSWWPAALKLKLTINERIRRLANTNEHDLDSFSEFLLDIGEGKVPYEADIGEFMIRIPDEYVFQSPQREDFIDWCFPNISRDANVGDRAILTPLNKDADELNDIALNKMLGDTSIHLSIDSVSTSDNDEVMNYPIEFLNSLSLSGMPAHNLKLKIGCPLILLRNLNPTLGLCNGTRLKLLSFTSRLLSVEILNGSHQGQTTFIPRIDLMTTEGALPFQMIRRQFPVKLGFAMTINKAQGQSLSQVGIYLPNPVFSHGQLYVALSRSGAKAKTKIFICDVDGIQGKFPNKPGIYTKNVVYAEALSS